MPLTEEYRVINRVTINEMGINSYNSYQRRSFCSTITCKFKTEAFTRYKTASHQGISTSQNLSLSLSLSLSLFLSLTLTLCFGRDARGGWNARFRRSLGDGWEA
jgi:hypothetical protein